MSTEHLLTFDENDNLQFIYSDELAFLSEMGATTTTRASHVEPTADGQWEADMSPSGGPVLGPFPLRSEALTAEVEWLKAKMCS